jgi:hypothetical protein
MGIRHAVQNLSAPSVVAGLVLGLACAGGGAIAAGQITGAGIKDKSITQKDIASDTLKSRNLKDGSVKGKDLKDGSLTNQDIDVFYAVLTDEGVVARQSGGVTGQRLVGEGPGRYAVDFNVDVTTCAYVATVGSVTFGAAEGQAGTGLLIGSVDTVRVNTTDSKGETVNKPFHLTVVC